MEVLIAIFLQDNGEFGEDVLDAVPAAGRAADALGEEVAGPGSTRRRVESGIAPDRIVALIEVPLPERPILAWPLAARTLPPPDTVRPPRWLGSPTEATPAPAHAPGRPVGPARAAHREKTVRAARCGTR